MPLSLVVRSGRDHDATDALIEVVERIGGAPLPVAGMPTAEDWGRSFDGSAALGGSVPADLISEARATYDELCRTQRTVRLLHGDLHHDNVLRDERRGWVAIDPRGVVAETGFELGVPLRNPHRMPELYTTRAIERRVARFTRGLGVDPQRTLCWCFAQAVLSAIWMAEDGLPFDADLPALRVAAAARTLLR